MKLSIIMLAVALTACAPTIHPGQSIDQVQASCNGPLKKVYRTETKKVYMGCGQANPLVFKDGTFSHFLTHEEADQDICAKQGYKLGTSAHLECLRLKQDSRNAKAMQDELMLMRAQQAQQSAYSDYLANEALLEAGRARHTQCSTVSGITSCTTD